MRLPCVVALALMGHGSGAPEGSREFQGEGRRLIKSSLQRFKILKVRTRAGEKVLLVAANRDILGWPVQPHVSLSLWGCFSVEAVGCPSGRWMFFG